MIRVINVQIWCKIAGKYIVNTTKKVNVSKKVLKRYVRYLRHYYKDSDIFIHSTENPKGFV